MYLKTIRLSLYISFKASVPIMLLRLITLLIGSFIPLINMIALKNIINGLVTTDYSITMYYFLLLGMAQILSAVIGKLTNFFATIHADKISLIITEDIIDGVNKLDISYFDTPKLFDEMMSVSRDINSIPSLIWTILSSIQVVVQLIIAFIIMANFGWWVSLFICLTCIPNFIVDKRNALQMYNWNRGIVSEVRKMNYSYDTLTSKYFSKDIRIKSITEYLKDKYYRKWFSWYNEKRKLTKKHFFGSFFTMFLPHAATLLFAYVLINNILQSKNTVGDFSYYLGIMNQLITCTFGLVGAISEIIQQKTKIEHYNKFKNWKPAILQPVNGIKATSFESLEFSHVSFSYPNTDELVLNDVSFVIHSGDRIGLVGKNGCGKSTIIKLILCLYKPTKGTILLNGIDVFKYDIGSYRMLISEMLQDYVNYSFTLRENIITADIQSDCTEEKIIKACRMSDAYSFIKKWPNGIDSFLTKSFDEQGVELSGGQWQKLALSRFFYKKASFYILDEPSASLDIEAESTIFNNVLNQLSGTTILLVSHRLSNIKMMSKIIVLDNGQMIETGSHDELMQKKGLYAYLYNIQQEKFN